MIYSSSTKKVANGFEFRVVTVEHNKPCVTVKSGVLPTRARAAAMGKKWKMYLTKNSAKVA
jgi:hypothetical protein